MERIFVYNEHGVPFYAWNSFLYPHSSLWVTIWNNDSLPKIHFFTWLLAVFQNFIFLLGCLLITKFSPLKICVGVALQGCHVVFYFYFRRKPPSICLWRVNIQRRFGRWCSLILSIGLISIFPTLISFQYQGEDINTVSIKKQVLKGFGKPSPSKLVGAFGCPKIKPF